MSKDIRITFRPTEELYKKIESVMKSGKYLKRSDLIRDAVWHGLDVILKETKK